MRLRAKREKELVRKMRPNGIEPLTLSVLRIRDNQLHQGLI